MMMFWGKLLVSPPIIPLDSPITLESCFRALRLGRRRGVCVRACAYECVCVFEEEGFRINQQQLLVEYPSLAFQHMHNLKPTGMGL